MRMCVLRVQHTHFWCYKPQIWVKDFHVVPRRYRRVSAPSKDATCPFFVKHVPSAVPSQPLLLHQFHRWISALIWYKPHSDAQWTDRPTLSERLVITDNVCLMVGRRVSRSKDTGRGRRSLEIHNQSESKLTAAAMAAASGPGPLPTDFKQRADLWPVLSNFLALPPDQRFLCDPPHPLLGSRPTTISTTLRPRGD